MNIAVIGTGYVGLTQGACLAHLGHQVVCVDVNQDRIDALNLGKVPFFEPGLNDLIHEGRKTGNLVFTTNYGRAMDTKPAVVFVCVGTPQDEDGQCDLSYIQSALQEVGEYANPSTLVVIKSTVPPGTREQMHAWLKNPDVQIASNPEFLRQGTAVKDFLYPDRIVFGVESATAEKVLRRVYEKFEAPVVVMGVEGAQIIKYAANTMLASRLSLMNEIANIADHFKADVKPIEQALGLDPRIGSAFLRSGAGFGGSCFPKDVLALEHAALKQGYAPRLIAPIIHVNKDQPHRLVKKIEERFGNIFGKTFAVWGLAFNKGTDDVRESPALAIVQALLALGARIQVFDPQAMDRAREELGERVVYGLSAAEAINGAEALLALTEWPEFAEADWGQVKATLKQPIIFDGKNFLPHRDLRAMGFEVHGIGLWGNAR